MNFLRRRFTSAGASLLVGVLALSGCGSEGATESSGTLAASPTFATNDSTSQVDIGVGAQPNPASESSAPPAGDAPIDTGVTEEPMTETPVTEAPSADPGPGEPGGRALDAALSPASDVATNQLPDLVVDDVRRGAKANFRNIFPADRPVLLWLWAPH